MLSERLRKRELFSDDRTIKRKCQALDMLDESTEMLVLLMKTIEDEELFERSDIEDYVVASIEDCEEKYYSMEDDEFSMFIRTFLKEK